MSEIRHVAAPLEPPTVSRETFERLETFIQLLNTWTKRINLVAKGDQHKLWERHVLDSVELEQLIPTTVQTAIDLGSGAGFPGLILSIATGLPFTLVEVDRRKAAFLTTAIHATGATAKVFAGRVESCRLPAADLITSRALASVSTLLSWSEHLRKADAVCLFPKSAAADDEVTSATTWTMSARRYKSAINADSVVWHLSEIKRADRS